MTSGHPSLAHLAGICGIEAQYGDARGGAHTAPPEALRAILAAMGVAAETEAEITDSIARIEAAAHSQLLPEAIIARHGTARLSVPGHVAWQLELDGGGLREGAGEGQIEIAGLPIGLHRLTLTQADRTGSATVLACPRTAPGCRDLAGRDRLWGVAAPLYGLRSGRNLGLGTFADLAELAEVTGAMGADYLAINPVHALFPAEPGFCSPYSPSHRRFLNTAHIAPDATPEFAASEPARRWLSQNRATIARLRDAELIDYPAVAALLGPLHEFLFDAFEARSGPGTPRGAEFSGWCTARGAELELFATHQALSERFGAFWTGWPAPYRNPTADEVARFAAGTRRRIRFHKYLQWLAETQLHAAQARARAAGMGLGLVSDLAVGVRPDGAETWAELGAELGAGSGGEPRVIARGVSLGAPPDAFNPAGQNWQLAPCDPAALRRDGYRAFAATLGRSMAWCGAIRIDHVVGFARSYWIPDGCRIGAYVHYPLDELLAVTAIEAHRRNCLVIGEDLGNVPTGLRARMGETGLHGCCLVYFERDWSSGAFTSPEHYRPLSAAALGSHDLPSFQGWWEGRDIAERARIGVIDADEAASERGARAGTRAKLAEALRDAGTLPDGWQPGDGPADDELILAVHRFLAATGSALATVQAENAFAMADQLNMPGTVDEHPNWRRRMPAANEWEGSALARSIARLMTELRPRAKSAKRPAQPGDRHEEAP